MIAAVWNDPQETGIIISCALVFQKKHASSLLYYINWAVFFGNIHYSSKNITSLHYSRNYPSY